MIDVEKLVPQVYVEQSRDFQFLSKLYTCIISGVKEDVNSILDTIDTHYTKGQLLNLLATKVGFFSKLKLNNESLRIILNGFPYMIKNKGNIKGVKQAVELFLKVNKIKHSYLDIIANYNQLWDYNMDEKLNESDADYLLHHVSFSADDYPLPENTNGDVNNDGKVNAIDVVMLQEIIQQGKTIIYIKLPTSIKKLDNTLLNELLQYVIPTGYYIIYDYD